MFTASFGIAKFLKTGPCQLLPEEGLCGGFMLMGFIFTFLNVAAMILSKAYLLESMTAGAITNGFGDKVFWGGSHEQYYSIITWFMICYLPNLIHVCICFISLPGNNLNNSANEK